MRRLGFLVLVVCAVGCGETSARLYVSQGGGPTTTGDVGSIRDSGLDAARADAEVPDAPSDSAADLVEEVAVPDVGLPDAEPDSSELSPACALIDETLVFGERILGEEHEEVIRVRNCGGFESENLVIETVEFVNDGVTTSSPEFSLSGIPEIPFGLLPNEAWPFPVRYSPTEPGEHGGVVRFTTNAPDAASVDVVITASVR